MSNDDTQFAWWSRLRHSGLMLSPVVQIEKYADPPEEPKWYQPDKLRTAHTRFLASIDRSKDRPQLAQGDILTWVDALLEKYIGHTDQRLARSHSIPEWLTAVVRIGSRTETLKPDRVLFAEDGKTPLLLIKTDTSPHIGRGKGRTEYARFLELLRGGGHRLGLLTNGLQFRLIYAGLDFESWCEWESERWFEDSEGTEELHGLRQLLFPTQATDSKGEVVAAGLPGLLHAIEESRKRQADLSQVLRENVRQAVELLLEDVSSASRANPDLFHVLVSPKSSDKQLSDDEAHEALLQATVRIVMRMVVCLFAESRGLLPVNDLIYSQAYGVRTLYELLDETTRHEGSQLGLMSRQSAWPRLMALFRLIHGGSAHGGFPLRPYGGALFRPGKPDDADPVSRALFILEHNVDVNDATIYRVLRKLLRGPLPVMRGRSKTYVEGPVDYTELRTEFIGLIYEGLLDYRVKRTTEDFGPQVFLNLGRSPVLPLSVLQKMLEEKPKDVKELFDKLSKEKVTATVSSDDEADESEADELDSTEGEDGAVEITVEKDANEEELRDESYLDAVQSARKWAREATIKTKRITAQRKKETDTEYEARVNESVDELIDRVVAPGEFYLIRAGNTRKGTGTFYTRPQLAVPTVHRTLERLCYDGDRKNGLVPKLPDQILGLKACDPACGSASFLVACLHYLTEALYKSLCHHCGLNDPKNAGKITLPLGMPAKGKDAEDVVPLPPDDPNRGEEFAERVQALLRRYIVERCIYGVDVNPLAVEFARVSLWIETLDPELPFSFLDHKIKVGNSLVGTWLNRVQDYPIMAWSRLQRESDKKGTLKDYSRAIKSRRDEPIKRLVREWIDEHGPQHQLEFPENDETVETVHRDISAAMETLHLLPMSADGISEREQVYQESVLADEGRLRLKEAMDAWCSIWFWPAQEIDSCPMPTDLGTDFSGKPATLAEIRRLAGEHRFFHWELEFPDVFFADNDGFDAMVGNPPWETSKPVAKEFFTEFDPLYRTYSDQEGKREQRKIFERDASAAERWRDYLARFGAMNTWVTHAGNPTGYHPRTQDGPSPFNLMDKGPQWRKSDVYHADWNKMRSGRFGYVGFDRQPFQLQGSADINLFKLFLELSYTLLNSQGRLGFVVPSSLYTDKGTRALREEFLDHASWEWLFGFENRKKIFEIDGRFKFAPTIVARNNEHGPVPLKAAFMVQELTAWEQEQPPVFDFDRRLIPLFSPKSRSLPEVRSQRDLGICETIYHDALTLFDDSPEGLALEYSREFHMGDDSKLFKARDKVEAGGCVVDRYGEWSDGESRFVPLYEGRMADQFDPSAKYWESGRGRSAVWNDIPFDNKTPCPQYLITEADFLGATQRKPGLKIGVMDVTSSTNTRTLIANAFRDFPTGHSLCTMKSSRPTEIMCFALSVLNSMTFDFVLRARLGGLHVSEFILSETPTPKSKRNLDRIALVCGRLAFVHCRFAPDWMRLREKYDELAGREWMEWWAITQADRLRLRVELDSLVADEYGLVPDDFEWVVRDDPSDPKGFWRVDKALPYEERLTGLSARAFRALKEGKWSAETVGQLSNDEFFDILGIPELTDSDAAQAKRLSGPLILKRKGCHAWCPESFPEDDLRHGWTWDNCRNDAITLLGSEEALDEFIATGPDDGNNDSGDEPFELRAEPAAKRDPQKRLF